MRKVYKEDQAKIKANDATAEQRAQWNNRVDITKRYRKEDNARIFIPRVASHKQGYKLAA